MLCWCHTSSASRGCSPPVLVTLLLLAELPLGFLLWPQCCSWGDMAQQGIPISQLRSWCSLPGFCRQAGGTHGLQAAFQFLHVQQAGVLPPCHLPRSGGNHQGWVRRYQLNQPGWGLVG